MTERSDLVENLDALVFYSSPAADIMFNEKNRTQEESLFERGVGYTAIHWATGPNLENGAQYEQLLGRWFNFKILRHQRRQTATIANRPQTSDMQRLE